MMGVLNDVETHTINDHLRKVFSESELEEASVIRNFRITASDGKSCNTRHYKLPAIIVSCTGPSTARRRLRSSTTERTPTSPTWAGLMALGR